MKRSISILFSIIALASCSTNTGTGVFSGGALGAGLGGVTGGGAGALIGTAAGVVAGGLVGAILDAQDRKIMEQSSPRTVDRMDRGEPLTLSDVIKLSQGGVSDDAIIIYLRDTKSTYNLSQTQIRRLQDAGVSQRVIDFMAEPS
jgi:outer membrane lipoprotein SlyB